MAVFAALGFPTTRQEEWRFTNVAPIAGTAFDLDADGDGVARPRPTSSRSATRWTHRLVLVNGRFAPELSDLDDLPEGVVVSSLAAALASASRADRAASRPASPTFAEHPFVALNTAL